MVYIITYNQALKPAPSVKPSPRKPEPATVAELDPLVRNYAFARADLNLTPQPPEMSCNPPCPNHQIPDDFEHGATVGYFW